MLVGLVDASLVQRDPMAPERVVLLETVREYADELLVASQEGPALARAHAAHYARLVERAEAELTASARLRKAIGTSRPPNDRREHEPIERAVRVALGSAASNAAVSAPHEEEAVLEALFAQVRQQSGRDGKLHHA